MYLKRRGAVYYYRRPIPKKHIGLWLGPSGKPRKEWGISLRTKDRSTAIDRMEGAARQYRTELDAKLKERADASSAASSGWSFIERMSRDEFDYWLECQEYEEQRTDELEWQQENDPLWAERTALATETSALRQKREDAEIHREIKLEERRANAVPIMDLFEDWASESGKPDTVAAYRSYLQHFTDYVGKADANDVTEDDIAGWRNTLRNGGGLSGEKISNRTINGAYMCAVKAVFRHACKESRRLRNDPARDLPALRVQTKAKLRPNSILDDEALLLLADAMEPGSERLSPHRKSAKRWCQWIMAYTGARVLEVAQLRKEDIGKKKGVAYVRITPEAGKNKTECARLVPLHPHLLQQGFLRFVEAQPEGPLFYDPALGRGGRLASQAKKVGGYLCERVRAVGVTVPQPNHGWRHRMETMNNRYELRDKVVRQILGHGQRDSNEGYGDDELPTMLREIQRIPAYVGPGLPPFDPDAEVPAS